MSKPDSDEPGEAQLLETYGEKVFDLESMKEYLPPKVYEALKETREKGNSLSPDIADDVAEGMMKWALSKGATHYTDRKSVV